MSKTKITVRQGLQDMQTLIIFMNHDIKHHTYMQRYLHNNKCKSSIWDTIVASDTQTTGEKLSEILNQTFEK